MIKEIFENLGSLGSDFVPVAIIKEHKTLQISKKTLDKLSQDSFKKLQELVEANDEAKNQIWGEIEDYLVEAGLIPNKEVTLTFKNGVLYQVNKSDED